MKNQNQTASNEHLARAKANNLHISTKHSIEICRHLRYKTTNTSKKILEDTIALKTPIPFQRFNRDVGHKPGMAAGRYPKKAAQDVLKLIKTVEANAQFKGLNTSNLKITKILANKASIPITGGRHRNATKRTNLEIEVIETKEKKKPKKVKVKEEPKKKTPQAEPKKEKIKEETKPKEKSVTQMSKMSLTQPEKEKKEEEVKEAKPGTQTSDSPEQSEGATTKASLTQPEKSPQEEKKEEPKTAEGEQPK